MTTKDMIKLSIKEAQKDYTRLKRLKNMLTKTELNADDYFQGLMDKESAMIRILRKRLKEELNEPNE